SEIRQNAENLSFSIQIQNTNEISGKIGCGGKVKGIVKVIKNTDELGKVETGDVLVSITTGPDYVPAMAKASAFVTDQGGITCHAAIVAREMEKPCIVGTGNATLLLNDGDLVEVDAENGTVKKLSD
ncbi:phosphoenolpyruvate synthase, partial [Candidatus Micrarchaeota archaeon]|nr:phosphoenolpyruvate synthase [Candidatus Micrarchaeota archaeon]